MQPIVLVPLLPVPEEIVYSLVSPLASVFHTSVSVDAHVDGIIDTAFDSSRGQFNSTKLIQFLLSRYGGSNSKVLGITSVDLFVPVLTYVFGEAQLNGIAGVMSVFRYDESLYGMEPNPVLTFERSVKEAIHELGHTYGLIHCKKYECSMHASTTAEDVDMKGTGLCAECFNTIDASSLQ